MKSVREVLFAFLLEPLVSSGRIGRIRFLLLHVWSAWPLFLTVPLASEHLPQWASYALSAFVVAGLIYWFVAMLAAGVRRLHDLGWSGYWVLLINLIWPVLLLWPGQRQANRYGPPVAKRFTARSLSGAA